MSDAPALLEETARRTPAAPDAAHPAPTATPTEQAPSAKDRHGAHRLVYWAMLFAIALGLLFTSDSLVSFAYDLPENALTERIVWAAEGWNREMQLARFAGLAERMRDWVATVSGE